MMPSTEKHRHSRSRSRLGWVGLVAALFLPLTGAHGAVNMHLTLPGVTGESTVVGQAGKIEVLAFSWGASNSGTTHLGGGGGAGVVNLRDLSLTKYVDRSSPTLLLRSMNGSRFATGALVVENTGSGSPAGYLSYELKDILVSSISSGGSDGEDRLTENVSLNFDYIKETYFITNASGVTTQGDSAYWTASLNQGGLDPGTGGPTNTAPTITAVANTSTAEDTAAIVSFTIGDTQTAAGALTLTRGSDNQTLVPTANIVLGGSGASRTATITPAANASGSATITLIVTDAGGLTATRTFTLTVTAANDAPTLAVVSDQVTPYGTARDVSVTVADIDSDVNSVVVTGTAAPSGIVASITDLTGTGTVRTLRVTPVAGASGSATVTLSASDGSQTGTRTFTFTVNPLTAPTAITLGGSTAATAVALPENSATNANLGTLVAVGAGAPVNFSLVDNAGGRFQIGGAANNELRVANGALLDFESLASYTVTIKATDQNNAAINRTDVFTINLSNVNEAPSVSLGTLPTIGPETNVALTGISISDGDPGASTASFVVTFSVSHGTLSLNASGALAGKITGNQTASVSVTAPVRSLNGALATTGLTYRGSNGYTGADTLTIVANDQGATGSGGAQTATLVRGFTVTATPYLLWQYTHFNATERANLAVSGPNADPDADGFANLVEYTLGSNPRLSTSGHAFVETTVLVIEGQSYLALRFPRRISDPQLTTFVEMASNLTNWLADGTTVEQSITPIDADFERVTVRSAVPFSSQSNQQMRIRVDLAASSPSS